MMYISNVRKVLVGFDYVSNPRESLNEECNCGSETD